MPIPLLPLLAPAAASAWNGVVNAFNGASGRTMQQNLEGQRLAHQKELQEKQKNLEGQRLAHQKELQEKQIVAQLQNEYIRTMS